MSLKNTMIYLMGFAGSGKLTIAKELNKQGDFTIVDNHYINNVVFKLIGRGPLPQGTWEQIEKVRTAVFDTIQNLSPLENNFIFTNELIADDPRAEIVYNRIQILAKKRQAVFLPVRLLVSAEELVKRVTSEEREALHKEMNVEAAIKKVESKQVFDAPEILSLQVTSLTAKEAADVILSELDKN